MSKISAPRSNREFIEACVKAGDAVRIKQEVDWENEAGAIAVSYTHLTLPTSDLV